MAAEDKYVLLLTVGSGNPQNLEQTLYTPLLKSIGEGNWDRIVFLPSVITENNATELQRRLPRVRTEILPLPQCDDENDVDACFAHFDRVIQKLRLEGIPAARICIDFTRGTKAMSAALVLAAISHEVPRMRYVEGDRDPARQNNVIPGTERVRTVQPQRATARRWLDQARAFLMDGDFAAVLEILPEPHVAAGSGWPSPLIAALVIVRDYAEFYSAWDRLDYSKAAVKKSELILKPENEWHKFAPTPAALDWVQELAQESPKKGGTPLPTSEAVRMVEHGRRVMVDLLANGRRRIRQRQFEDANLRGYRIAEMLGQVRLFKHGLDSSFLDPQHPVIARFQKDLEKNHSRPLGRTEYRNRQYLTTAREQTFRLLGRLNDDFSEKLRKVGPEVEKRNHSILIHGFDRLDLLDATSLTETYDHLEQLLREDLGTTADAWLGVAHFQDQFFR